MQSCIAVNLNEGDKIKIGDTLATVKGVRWCDGKNGAPHRFMSVNGGKSAVAMEIEFADREPMFVHPRQQIDVSLS